MLRGNTTQLRQALKPTSENQPLRLAFVLIPRFNMMTLTTLIEPVRIANYLSERPLYEWAYLSFDAPAATASNAMSVECQRVDKSHPDHYDLIFILASWGCEHYHCPDLFSWIKHRYSSGVTLCAMETAIYALARAKILAQKRATTHWSIMAGFAEQYPKVCLTEQLFTIDNNLITCSGGTAGIDLMLQLIGERHGEHLSAEITDQMIHYPIRPAKALQRHTHGFVSEVIHPSIDRAIKLIEANITEPLKVPEIARQAGISQRQLERYFKRFLGCSVVQFSRLLRLQYARVLLTSSDISIREVSAASGFNSMSHFASAFVNCFGKKPSQYRHAWPDTETAPSWPGTLFSLIQTSRLNALRRRPSRA